MVVSLRGCQVGPYLDSNDVEARSYRTLVQLIVVKNPIWFQFHKISKYIILNFHGMLIFIKGAFFFSSLLNLDRWSFSIHIIIKNFNSSNKKGISA